MNNFIHERFVFVMMSFLHLLFVRVRTQFSRYWTTLQLTTSSPTSLYLSHTIPHTLPHIRRPSVTPAACPHGSEAPGFFYRL